MDKMSLMAVLFVSVPEQIILFVMVAIMVARFDLLKPSRSNLIKVTLVTVFNTAVVVLIRGYSPYFMVNLIVSIFFVSFLYAYMLKVMWHEAIVAIFLVLAGIFILEMSVYFILLRIADTSIESVLSSDLYRIISSLPVRIIQIFAIILLRKAPVVIIDLKPLKQTANFIKRFSALFICFFLSMLLIANTVKLIVFELPGKINFTIMEFSIMNVMFAIAAMLTSLYLFVKNKKNYEKQRQDYLEAINHIERLLYSGNNGVIRAKEIITIEKHRWGR